MAGLAGGATLPTTVRASAAESPTVMTRNLYLGVDLARLFEADSLAGIRRVAGELFTAIRRRPFAPRAAAIAAEIEATSPDVVCLQEAARIRTQRPSDFGSRPVTNASTVYVDFLDVLASKLEARNLSYQVAASTVTTDVEVPADVDGETIDVRLTDRDAVLVRTGVETGATPTGTYEASYAPPNVPAGLGLTRGYCLVDVTLGGVETTVATTHLESADEGIRREQSRELLELLPADRPVVLAGDFNSSPGAAAYDLLTETFTDAYTSVRPDADGFTCCQAPDLRNETSKLSKRIDGVLSRGGVEPTGVSRVGADPADRVAADVDGKTARLWPSDHAGVVATFEVTATPTPTRTTTESTRTRTTTETTATGPGFGVAAAVGGVVAGALARLRRGE